MHSLYEKPRSALSAAADLNQHRSTHKRVEHERASFLQVLYAYCAATPPYAASASGKFDLGHGDVLRPRCSPPGLLALSTSALPPEKVLELLQSNTLVKTP